MNDRECLRRVLELLKLGQIGRAMKLIRRHLEEGPPCQE